MMTCPVEAELEAEDLLGAVTDTVLSPENTTREEMFWSVAGPIPGTESS